MLRTMKGTFSRFIAIAAIVALGVGLLSGLMAMPIDMRTTIDEYFDRQNMHDLRIVSPLGLTDDDVAAIAAVDGVDEVMPAYMTDMFVDAGEKKNIVTRIHSLPTGQIEEKEPENYLNRLDVVEGRLPIQRNECVLVEGNVIDGTGPLSVGNTLTIAATNGDVSGTLADTEFKIVGIVRTSYYFSVDRESATIGDGTVALKMYVGEESFSQEAYSEIFATVAGAQALDSASDEYQAAVDAVADRVEAVSGARCTARYNEVKTDTEQKLADARQELEDAKAEAAEKLGDAEEQLDEGRAELEDAQAQLDSAKNQIASGEKELQANKESLPGTLTQKQQELAAGQAALIDAKAQIEENEALLNDKKQELADAKAQLAAAKQLVETLEPTVAEGEARLPELAAAQPALREAAAAAQETYDAAAAAADLSGKQAAYEAAQSRANTAKSERDAAQAQVDAGMSAAGCATEDKWLATEPVAAKAAIDARDAAQVELDTANAALNAAQAEYSAAQTAVAPAKAALDTANAQLASAQAAYDTSSAALAAARTQLDTAKAQITEAEPQIAEGEKQLADGQQQLAAAKKQVLEAEKQIASGETALSLAPGLAQLQLELAQSKLDSAKAQYEDGLAQLEDGKAELEDGEAEYEKQKKDVEQQLADAEAEIADGEQKLAELEVPEWMILDRTSHVSASSYLSNVDKLEAITTVFPIFFFLVAALVALTTMTRMVEEERLQIGTLKALGYKRGQIMFKYLFYAWVATLVGGAAGLAFGFTVIPIVIWNAYGTMYTIPGFRCLFHASLAVLGVGAALLCTSAATLNACGQTLKEWAAQLLLPKAPKAGKRIFLERITPVWKRMKFTHKVTARNLFRYKKRFFMTVIGVAGCTALLVTGFGLKDSISDIVSKQFGKVFTYDFLVTLSKESALKDAGFQALMDAPEQVTSYLPVQQERISLDVDGQSYDVYLFAPEDEARLDNFIDLHERKSGAAVPLTDDGVVITEKFSDEAGLSPGDTLTLENGEGREGTFTVTGVAENYVENYVYMTPSVYEDAYGSALEYNSVLGILPDDAQDVDEAFSTSLLEVDGVAGLTQMSSMRSSLDDTIASINYVVYVIILCAGMLAFVVLYNLMNINITERTKEIATIKVLGFFEREVEAYVYRESNVLTVIGMLLGLVGGIFLHMFIMRTVEVDMVMFGRDIKPLSFVLSAVLTVVFSLLVNLGMKRKLRNISMVESMKAPE